MLDASYESAGTEDAERVENFFYFLHFREIAAFRSPDFERGFPFWRTPRNRRIRSEARPGSKDLICGGNDLAMRRLAAVRWKKHEIDHAQASRHGY